MRIALFSDVHGNLSALQAVQRAIAQRADIDQTIFAGDLCAFGPRPQECLDLLRDMAVPAIVGNTDEWIRQPPPPDDDLPDEKRFARQALRRLCRWTEEILSQESLAWLDDLRQAFQIRLTPSSDPLDDLLIVHANPKDLTGIIFPAPDRQIELYGKIRQDDQQLAPLMEGVAARTIAFGHLHIPGQRMWRDKTLLNISSVSMPGDGDGRAKYAVLTWRKDSGWTAEYQRIQYSSDDEVAAFQRNRPPFWKENVKQLESAGFIPQVV
jgi:predicted phosphodiesterase